jgi:hypothetical protein
MANSAGAMMGPVDYVVLGFEGNKFTGGILDELSKAVKNKMIRVLDILFIMKDKDGNVMEAEYEDQSDDLKKTFGDLKFSDDTPMLSESDVAKLGDMMDNNTAAGVLVYENEWAKGIKEEIKRAGGFLIDDGRIHPEKVQQAVKELETAGKA